MNDASGLLLVPTVAVVGVFHTIVPDHWAPIALLARQRGWSKGETVRAALLGCRGQPGQRTYPIGAASRYRPSPSDS
jgi:hypothetical protein